MTIDPAALTTEDCWSCPACAFTFAAYHANSDGSLTCPVCEVEEKDRRATDLESRLATAHDMLRHYEQERDSWGAAYRQRAERTDARIKELEKQNDRMVAIITACDERGEVGCTVDLLAAARAKIAELEAAVAQGFLDLGAANQRIHALVASLTDLYKIAKLGSGPVGPASAEAIERARRLLNLEEI